MMHHMHHALFCLALTAIASGQTFELKDRNGTPVVRISSVKMFREDVPVFEGIVTNVSGVNVAMDPLNGTVHKKDGSTVKFSFSVCDVRWCDFEKDSVNEVRYAFPQPWPFTRVDFDSVEFSFPGSWVSPEDQRKATEAQAKKDSAEAARRRRLAAARKNKEEEERACRDGIMANEAAKIRVACKVTYKGTADKKIGDLTVKESQQVQACQALGLYPPR